MRDILFEKSPCVIIILYFMQAYLMIDGGTARGRKLGELHIKVLFQGTDAGVTDTLHASLLRSQDLS